MTKWPISKCTLFGQHVNNRQREITYVDFTDILNSILLLVHKTEDDNGITTLEKFVSTNS